MQKYYEINEEQARRAKAMWSFTDYENGTETEYYKRQVDYAYNLCAEAPTEYQQKAYELADRYSKKLANHINKGFNIEMMCPSIMISGGSNFPTRKKEKQNERRENHMKEYDYIQDYLNKLENIKYYKPRVEKQGVARELNLDNKYFKVIQNEELNRLQLVFENIPSSEVRDILKSNGFKWSPKNQTWQRQLTNNAIYSVKLIVNNLSKM